MRTPLEGIIDRLKRGEHVSSTDRSIYEMPEKEARRVGNVLKNFHVGCKRNRDRLNRLMDSESWPSNDPRVINYFRDEKRRRLHVIDRLEDMLD